jgi:uncharacterized membrane protein YidH (DUF202 family)
VIDEAEPDEDLERTELAWNRSGLALAAIGLVLLRRLLPILQDRVAEGLIIVGLGLAFSATVLAYQRHRRHRQLPSRSALKLVAAATTLIGLAAFVVAVVSTA